MPETHFDLDRSHIFSIDYDYSKSGLTAVAANLLSHFIEGAPLWKLRSLSTISCAN
jgi:hypothetical protein